MAQVTLKGNPVQVDGQLPQVGQQAPAFSLVAKELEGTLDIYSAERLLGTLSDCLANSDTITLVREDWVAPTELDFGDHTLVPLRAGEKLRWRVLEGAA